MPSPLGAALSVSQEKAVPWLTKGGQLSFIMMRWSKTAMGVSLLAVRLTEPKKRCHGKSLRAHPFHPKRIA